MVANNQPEGNPVEAGDVNANSQPSQIQSQPSSGNLAETIANLQKKVDAQEGEIRALKGGKDKAVDRAIKSQEQTLATIAKYLKVDEEQVREAQRQSVLDDLISERLGGGQPAPTIQGRVGSAGESAGSSTVDNFSVADAIAEVESYELPVNDPSFLALLRKNPDRQMVKDYILEQKKPIKSPNPADVVQSPVRGGAQEKSTDVLTQDYKNEMLAAPRGKSGDAIRRAIKDKYIQKGVNIHNVDFT